MKTKFSKAKIYKVKSKNTDKVYIGSTTRSLRHRHEQHIYEYNRCCRKGTRESTIFEVMKHGDYWIELVEKYPCKTKAELHNREAYWQIEAGDLCVNRILPSEGGRRNHRFICGCGSDVRWYGRNQHGTSLKHKEFEQEMARLNA